MNNIKLAHMFFLLQIVTWFSRDRVYRWAGIKVWETPIDKYALSKAFQPSLQTLQDDKVGSMISKVVITNTKISFYNTGLSEKRNFAYP